METSQTGSLPVPFTLVDADEWNDMVAAGSVGGSLHADTVAHVLRKVELTGDVLVEVQRLLALRGIAIDDHVEDLHDETPPVGLVLDRQGADDADAEGLLTRRLRRRAVRAQHDKSEAVSGDTVRQYLKEIGRVDLLTAEDERRLAQAIDDGHRAAATLDSVHAGAEIDASQQRRLLRTVQVGQRAKTELIQANLRLVVSIAKRYSGRGMLFLDLIQEGNLGLMRAVDKFDHTKGFKFSTYATWWIRQAITRSIADQARTIRIPVHMVESMNRVLRTQRQMHQDLEREPTLEELAAAVGMTEDRVRDILRISQDPLSLDSPVGEEEDSNLADFIEDPTAEAPADAATQQMRKEAVRAVLSELTEREQEILVMRYGLDGMQARTLEDVGREFGVTRERIRQIEAKTLAKLRHPQRSQRLKEFLDEE